MSSTSKYIQLNKNILLEYVYTDQSNPEEISVSDNPIEILTNEHNTTNYMFNSDSMLIDSGNLRDRSAVPIDEAGTYAFLNKDLPLNYNDYDDNLTATENLKINFDNASQTVIYDTVKIHLQTGFSFEKEGYLFEIYFDQRGSSRSYVLALVLKKGDSYAQMNPNPFTIANKLYTNYIELKVPAFMYLTAPHNSNPPTNDDALNSRLTSKNVQTIAVPDAKNLGIGFNRTGMINIGLKNIYDIYNDNGFTYLKTSNIIETSITIKDNFDLLVARIKEANDGDYFELYGEYNGLIFEDFISNLNNQPNSNYVVFHDYKVLEQVGVSFTETSSQTIIQNNNWDKPMLYRPIILNSENAVSYIIQYELRLINTFDNSQIIKKSQFSSYEVKKYGKNMTRINLGLTPTVVNVYNKIEQNVLEGFSQSGQISTSELASSNPVNIITEYINVYRDKINIKAKSTKIK